MATFKWVLYDEWSHDAISKYNRWRHAGSQPGDDDSRPATLLQQQQQLNGQQCKLGGALDRLLRDAGGCRERGESNQPRSAWLFTHLDCNYRPTILRKQRGCVMGNRFTLSLTYWVARRSFIGLLHQCIITVWIIVKRQIAYPVTLAK